MVKVNLRVPKKKSSPKTVRELSTGTKKTKRIRRVSVPGKLKKLPTKLQKSYHLPLPDSKAGNILSKKVNLYPSFIKNSLIELRQVNWPDRRTTIKLSFAVIIFATVFGTIVALLDFGLDKIFKEVILKK